MKISKAVFQKITKICIEKDISLNELAGICCITQSTLQSLINEDSHNPKLLTIVRICDGLDITLQDFFADDLFKNIDRED